MRRRYGSLVTQALLEQNSRVALDAYEQTQILPETATEALFHLEGFTINGNYNGGNDAFIIIHNRFTSYLLKSMTAKETARASALLLSIDRETQRLRQLNMSFDMPNLTPFELRFVRNKNFMLMPQYMNTVEIVGPLSVEDGISLYRQIARALDFLHNLPERYNHMDVKPSNICVREGNILVLIDLGSVAPLGCISESTRVYVPRDFQPRPRDNPTSNIYNAEAPNDWWMLAMTLAEKVYGLPVGLGATPPPTMAQLREILQDEVWAELIVKLVAGSH
jgi:serine/threonine protein kinase